MVFFGGFLLGFLGGTGGSVFLGFFECNTNILHTEYPLEFWEVYP